MFYITVVYIVCQYWLIFDFSLIEPCDGCAAPYGYKNIMRLSQDTSKFAVLKYL